ncbi:uncharacterized protein LOC144106193 isoform X2 [Amblyomma americanum]
MSGRKTTTTTWYQEDDLFAKGALFALVAGVVTLLVLFFGSNFSDRDTVKPVARAAGAAVVSAEAANATMASRRPPPFRQRTTGQAFRAGGSSQLLPPCGDALGRDQHAEPCKCAAAAVTLSTRMSY